MTKEERDNTHYVCIKEMEPICRRLHFKKKNTNFKMFRFYELKFTKRKHRIKLFKIKNYIKSLISSIIESYLALSLNSFETLPHFLQT